MKKLLLLLLPLVLIACKDANISVKEPEQQEIDSRVPAASYYLSLADFYVQDGLNQFPEFDTIIADDIHLNIDFGTFVRDGVSLDGFPNINNFSRERMYNYFRISNYPLDSYKTKITISCSVQNENSIISLLVYSSGVYQGKIQLLSERSFNSYSYVFNSGSKEFEFFPVYEPYSKVNGKLRIGDITIQRVFE